MTSAEIGAGGADGDLLMKMRDGDADAFAALMRRNNRRLYRIARGILKDDHEAEEAVQEGYVRAFTHLDGYRGEASLSTWLARVVANEALGRLRRRRANVEIGDLAHSIAADPRAADYGSAVIDPEHTAARREIRRLIERAVDALPAPFRVVFVLRAIEQLSVRETACCLDIPEETVKTRFYRANRLLRQSLRRHFNAIWDDAFPFAGARCDGLVARVLARCGQGLAIASLSSVEPQASGGPAAVM